MKDKIVTASSITLKDEFIKSFPPIIIFLGTAIIYLCFFKDLVRVGFNAEWLMIRLGYLPFMMAVWQFSKRKILATRFYEAPLWFAGIYITLLCAYFSFSTGGLKSDYAFGLIQFYFVISVMPLTAFTFCGVSICSLLIYIGLNTLMFGSGILHDNVVITAMLPLLIFSPIIYVITSRIRAAKLALQNTLANTLVKQDEVIATQSSALADVETKAALGLMVAQVAHDIRSPVAVLNMIASGLLGYNEETQSMIRDATGRINDIANNLLMKFRSKPGELNALHSVHSLVDSISKIIAEKRMQYESAAINFNFKIAQNIQEGNVSYQVSDFMRVISNILNNAVESIVGNGLIDVCVTTKSDQVVIAIVDNGCGMSQETLEKVCQQGQTTKENGFGLGLYHARSVLDELNGSLAVDSEVGLGTAITLSLPLVVVGHGL
jgi:signal transduction histidine kinase